MRIIEERKNLVILFLLQRIELVIVALRAADSQAQHALADRVHAVEHRFHAKLLRVHAAFFVDHRIAQKARRHNLVLRRLRQKIAGQLINYELVIRKIAI